MATGNRELEATFHGFKKADLQKRIASGELTDEEKDVAIAELYRRFKSQETLEVDSESDVGSDSESAGPPSGWPYGSWVGVFVASLALVLTFAWPRNANFKELSNTWGFFCLQALMLTILIRTIAAVFCSKSASGFVGRIVAAGLIGIVFFGLVLCSTFHWQGG